jgi:predicted nucleic acid-binding protein
VILYADTSALVKLLVREEGSDEMAQHTRAAEAVATASIAYAELRAAFAAMARAGHLSASLLGRVKRDLAVRWALVSPMSTDDLIIADAGDLAERHALRGFDAIHLASLMRLGPPRPDLLFAVWDADLLAAARVEGYATIP